MSDTRKPCWRCGCTSGKSAIIGRCLYCGVAVEPVTASPPVAPCPHGHTYPETCSRCTLPALVEPVDAPRPPEVAVLWEGNVPTIARTVRIKRVQIGSHGTAVMMPVTEDACGKEMPLYHTEAEALAVHLARLLAAAKAEAEERDHIIANLYRAAGVDRSDREYLTIRAENAEAALATVTAQRDAAVEACRERYVPRTNWDAPVISETTLKVMTLELDPATPSRPYPLLLQRAPQRLGDPPELDLWKITDASSSAQNLNKNGEWEWEPLPSSRTDEFLRRCRFVHIGDAIATWRTHLAAAERIGKGGAG